MSEADEVLVRMRGASKVYRMGEVDVHALREVDLEVRAGEMLVVVGPSGSGKSTLLHLLGGMARPSSGEVWFGETELAGADDATLTRIRRQRVGFVFQFYNLVPSLTALENVMVATDIADDPLDPAEALERVGLGDRAEHFPAQLSGGEQQRVAVARALASNPRLLLCDEPTGALDLETGRKILGLLRDLQEETGKAVVVITHNSAIAQIADRVAHLRDGAVVAVEEVADPLPIAELTW